MTDRKSRGKPSLRFVDHGGDKPSLLLLHGVTRCGEDWSPILPSLTQAWRVIALDQRGHGGSERADRYLVIDYIADVVRWLRDEIASPVTILGHSLGAMVAAGVAAQAPQFVRDVVLEDPPFHTMGNRIAGTAWQAQFIGMRQVARDGGTVQKIADGLAEIRIPLHGNGFKRLGELRDRSSLEWSAECLSQIDPEILTPVIDGGWLDGYNLEEIRSAIRCPVLLLQGDPAVGGALTDLDAENFAASSSACQLVRFPGCGHQLHRDRPLDVLKALQDFADANRSSA